MTTKTETKTFYTEISCTSEEKKFVDAVVELTEKIRDTEPDICDHFTFEELIGFFIHDLSRFGYVDLSNYN